MFDGSTVIAKQYLMYSAERENNQKRDSDCLDTNND